MLKVKEAIIVEGKYDKIKLTSIIDALIIETGGFDIFQNKEKLDMIKAIAKKNGIIIVTDSDSSGFKIRRYLMSAIDKSCIKHVYIPDIIGKEKRKTAPSSEGKLGVEGVSKQVILTAFHKAGIFTTETPVKTKKLTKSDLYELGLTGKENSHRIRALVLQKLDLPEHLTTNSMLDVLNTIYTYKEFVDFFERLNTDCE